MTAQKIIELIELPSDWLDVFREQKLARRREAIRQKHRRRYLRRLRREAQQGGSDGETTQSEG